MRISMIGLLAVAATTAIGRTATASPEDDAREQRAQNLFLQSREAAKRGDYLTACAGFRESQTLVATPGTLLNLADCEERSGKIAQALADFEEVGRELAASDPRAQVASVRSTALAERVPRVTVRITGGRPTDGVHVTLEPTGQDVPLESAVRLDPGDYRIVIHSPTGQDRAFPITLHESESKEVVTEAANAAQPSEQAPPPAASVAPAAATAPAPGGPPKGRRELGFAVGGAGVVLLGLGVATGIAVAAEAQSYKDNCTDGCNSSGAHAAAVGRVLGVVSPVALGLGAAAAGIGAYLILTSPHAPVTLAARTTAGGGWVGCGVAF
jgi:hypothetical protein